MFFRKFGFKLLIVLLARNPKILLWFVFFFFFIKKMASLVIKITHRVERFIAHKKTCQ